MGVDVPIGRPASAVMGSLEEELVGLEWALNDLEHDTKERLDSIKARQRVQRGLRKSLKLAECAGQTRLVPCYIVRLTSFWIY